MWLLEIAYPSLTPHVPCLALKTTDLLNMICALPVDPLSQNLGQIMRAAGRRCRHASRRTCWQSWAARGLITGGSSGAPPAPAPPSTKTPTPHLPGMLWSGAASAGSCTPPAPSPQVWSFAAPLVCVSRLADSHDAVGLKVLLCLGLSCSLSGLAPQPACGTVPAL